jgi:hypothetical protein
MTTKTNPLAVMDAAKEQLVALGGDFGDAVEDQEHIDLIEDFCEARAAVAEVVATGRRAEVMFNTVRGCYERNPVNFAVAMRELEREVIDFRAALAAFEVTP